MTNPVFIKYSYSNNGTTTHSEFIAENQDSYIIDDWKVYIQNNYILIALEFINIDKIIKLY